MKLTTTIEIVTMLALIPLALFVYSICTALAIYQAVRAAWK